MHIIHEQNAYNPSRIQAAATVCLSYVDDMCIIAAADIICILHMDYMHIMSVVSDFRLAIHISFVYDMSIIFL